MADEKKTALIIDDAHEIQTIFKALCQKLGYEALPAKSVPEGLAMMVKKKPDMIVLDINMPEMGGLDFLAMRLTHPALMKIPVVVSSARKDQGTVEKAISLGANDYLLKPINPSFMSHRMKKHIGGADFKIRRFLDHERPFLNLFDEEKKLGGSKLLEIDEAGMTINCRHLITPGNSYRLFGEAFRNMIKRSKPITVNCLSISMNPQYETYTAYLAFDSADPDISENAREWIVAA